MMMFLLSPLKDLQMIRRSENNNSTGKTVEKKAGKSVFAHMTVTDRCLTNDVQVRRTREESLLHNKHKITIFLNTFAPWHLHRAPPRLVSAAMRCLHS